MGFPKADHADMSVPPHILFLLLTVTLPTERWAPEFPPAESGRVGAVSASMSGVGGRNEAMSYKKKKKKEAGSECFLSGYLSGGPGHQVAWTPTLRGEAR